jgi:signal transduction histidine kinase
MIFRSFYARISLLFLLLVFILGGSSLMIAFNASRHLFDEVEQLLNREYASSIAEELESIVDEDLSKAPVSEAIHYMMVLNPMVEIYLLDSNGAILSYFAGGEDRLIREKIDTQPLKQFRNSRGFETVLGDDPRTEDSLKPFSAAPLQISEHEEGWVYVILRGQSYDHSLALAQSNYYVRSGLFTFIIATLATLIVGLFLFFLLTYRLKKLSLGIQAFKDGHFEHRIEVKGKDEIAQLSQGFNEMAASIQDGIDKLKDADRSRSQLIANISHDLRSPLTSIRGHLETLLLKENTISEREQREFIEITLRNVADFQRLVEELLDLAKLEARQVSPQPIPFSLAELIQDVVLKMSARTERKHISIQYDPDPGLPSFTGDIGLIERALTNVIGNAIEHSPESGIITMELHQQKAEYTISIADSGNGIPEDDLPHVFERFYRTDKSRTRTTRGTGLGLAIAKEVVELHNGKIYAANSETGGALITIRLPLNV